jgi:hypothetical protein
MKGRFMRHFPLLAAACLGLAAPHAALAQDKAPTPTMASNPRGVYATINMRATQEMVARLSAAYGSDHHLAIKEVLSDPGAYMPPVLYALANTRAEDHPEEAIFWYHVGRMRAVYDALRCRDKSANAGLLDLRTHISKTLAFSQFYRRERLIGIAQKAIDWDTQNPRSYDQRWISLYGKAAASSAGTDPVEIMVPESEWPAILKHVHESHLKSVEDFVAEKGAK